MDASPIKDLRFQMSWEVLKSLEFRYDYSFINWLGKLWKRAH